MIFLTPVLVDDEMARKERHVLDVLLSALAIRTLVLVVKSDDLWATGSFKILIGQVNEADSRSQSFEFGFSSLVKKE